MNKKIIVSFTLILTIAMMLTPLAMAKPGAEKNNPKKLSFLWHTEGGASTPIEGYPIINPPWAIGTPDAKVSHTQSTWALGTDPVNNHYIQIEGYASIPIDNSNYEGYLYVMSRTWTPLSQSLNYRVLEKFSWGDNFIEIMSLERASLELFLDSEGNMIGIDFYASGTFSGHGEIDGQKVQLSGVREAGFGPAGFQIENIGTIQFVGNGV